MKQKTLTPANAGKEFERLIGIMDELREKCPWDQKQTFESLRHLTLEEAYELTDAILNRDMEHIRKELGDLLLHIVFYSRIASETGEFSLKDVVTGLCEKLIYRHPHIYGDVIAVNAEQVKENWEKLKLMEDDGKGGIAKKSILQGIPVSMPAMIKAIRIQEKMKRVGFDWDNKEQVWKKVMEELNELKNEVDSRGECKNTEEELGDLLFVLINYARFIDVNPEDALEKTNRKVINRFRKLEEEATKDGKNIKIMSLAEMEAYWQKVKKLVKPQVKNSLKTTAIKRQVQKPGHSAK